MDLVVVLERHDVYFCSLVLAAALEALDGTQALKCAAAYAAGVQMNGKADVT